MPHHTSNAEWRGTHLDDQVDYMAKAPDPRLEPTQAREEPLHLAEHHRVGLRIVAGDSEDLNGEDQYNHCRIIVHACLVVNVKVLEALHQLSSKMGPRMSTGQPGCEKRRQHGTAKGRE